MFRILNSKINSRFLLNWHILSQAFHVFQFNVVNWQLTIVDVISSSGTLIEYVSVFKESLTFLRCSVISDLVLFSIGDVSVSLYVDAVLACLRSSGVCHRAFWSNGWSCSCGDHLFVLGVTSSLRNCFTH